MFIDHLNISYFMTSKMHILVGDEVNVCFWMKKNFVEVFKVSRLFELYTIACGIVKSLINLATEWICLELI